MADIQEDAAIIGIPWRSWGVDAFREAQERDLPILLDISATWCHWCHVMDQETYRDPEVIRRVAAEVVPVRIDNDRRPDLNSRYNLGGWPTTAFLTPEGDLLSGSTFMPADAFLESLSEVTTYYRDQRADLEAKVQRRRARRARIHELRQRLRGEVSVDIVNTVTQSVMTAYDPRYGGFGNEPKFPVPEVLEFALAVGQGTHDGALLDVAGSTLTAMATGGVYDSVGGGFFRYSVTADWADPHYEKLLETNARLLDDCLQAVQVFGDDLYRRTAHEIIAFADDVLSDPSGAFAGSVDADEQYYHLRADARAERQPPAVDPTLFTDWNAMMVRALLRGAVVFGEPALADRAVEALEAIWERNFVPGAGMAHYYDGSPHLPGLLVDLAWMGHALLDADAYVAAGDFRQRAETLLDIIYARLLDPDVGGFYDIPFHPSDQGRLQDRHKLLDQNAIAADLALRLYRLTGIEKHHEAAVGCLEAMAPLYGPYRHHAAPYGLTVYRYVHTPLHLIIVGDTAAKLSQQLRLAALAIYDPNVLVESVDPLRQHGRLDQLGLSAQPQPVLYVRRGAQTCAPVQDPAQVAQAVQAVPA